MGEIRRRRTIMKTPLQPCRRNWRAMFRRHRRKHDPMLVLNLEDFNFADGWDRILNPFKTRERGN
jgi:hypothetical protein